MPFPAGLTLVTVHGQFDTLPSGGASGMVRFVSPSALQGSVDNSIVPYVDVTVGLDSSGTFITQLPATDATGWSPSGWAYTVTANLGVRTITGTLQLAAANTSVELADLFQPDGAAESGTTYILLAQKGVYGGVAALDASTGEVLDGDGNPVSGGGGTPSGTVVAETSYGQASSAGNASAYSRGNHTHGTPAAPAAATISDSTATGQALITAVSASAARTTLGLGGAAVLDVGTGSGNVAAGDAPAGAVTTHVGLGDPHTQYALEANLGGAALLNVGTTAGTVAAGDDSRITGAVQKSTVTTKGDLYVATASATVTRLAAGANGRYLMADSGATEGVSWADPATPAFPISHFGFVAASGDPGNYYLRSGVNSQVWCTRVWVPAGKAIAGIYAAIGDAGTHDGATNGNGLAIYDDSGNLVDSTAMDNALWATAGWRGATPSGGTIAAQGAGRWVYAAVMVRGWAAANPTLAYPQGANDRAYMYTGPATTKRRTFYNSTAGSWPSTIDPTSTGTATGYNFLIGLT